MSTQATMAAILQRFFTERLMAQRQVSPHTMASYRDSFRLLLVFAQHHRRKCPCDLDLQDLDAELISAFLKSLESSVTAVHAHAMRGSQPFDRSFAMPRSRNRPSRSISSVCLRFPTSDKRGRW
jgi:site-specific recombinase XerC